MASPTKNPYKDLTWPEWSAMSWREKARVRRFREPPPAPVQVFLALSAKQQFQLAQIAKRNKLSVNQLASQIVARSVDRRARQLKRPKQARLNGGQHVSNQGRARRAA